MTVAFHAHRVSTEEAGESHFDTCTAADRVLSFRSIIIIVIITASDGEARSFRAGDAYLFEDTWGIGHKAEVASQVLVTAVLVHLPDAA